MHEKCRKNAEHFSIFFMLQFAVVFQVQKDPLKMDHGPAAPILQTSPRWSQKLSSMIPGTMTDQNITLYLYAYVTSTLVPRLSSFHVCNSRLKYE